MKKSIIPIFVMLAITIACKKKETSTLKITDVQVEIHDEHATMQRGSVLSVNFTATASDAARLDYYHIEIHDHPASGKESDEYKIIDSSFKDKPTFKGLRNAKVHEHVHVPDTANLGTYHVVVFVADEAGNSVDTEDMNMHITIEK